MGAYRISFTISAAPAITNYFIAVLYKTTAPSVEVQRVLLGNVHTSPQNVAFNDVDGGIYLVKIHESTNNSTLGNLRHDFEIDARTNKILQERRFYRVDGGGAYDPLTGSTSITDPYFEGKTISGVFQEGYRYLKPDTEWHQDAGGVLNFLNDLGSGTQITNSTNAVWTVEITYSVTMPDVTTIGDFTTIVNVTANTTLTSTDVNNVFAFAGAGSTVVAILPSMGTIVEGKGFLIQHDGGNAVNVKVLPSVGEIFRFRGVDTPIIYLGKGEFVKFVKKIVGATSKWYVVDYRGQWDRIGEQVAADVTLDNSLVMDGTTYDGNVYMRAYDFIANRVPAAQKVTFVTWTTTPTKQSLFAIDTTTKQFIVPNRLNLSTRFIKTLAGGSDAERTDNVPGGFQAGQVGEFDGNVTIDKAFTSIDQTGVGHLTTGSSANEPADAVIHMKFQTGKDNIVKNAGALPLFLI